MPSSCDTARHLRPLTVNPVQDRATQMYPEITWKQTWHWDIGWIAPCPPELQRGSLGKMVWGRFEGICQLCL